MNYIIASIEDSTKNITLTQKEVAEIPSYCFNISAPTTYDQELEDLRRQLIFWVEGKIWIKMSDQILHGFYFLRLFYQ